MARIGHRLSCIFVSSRSYDKPVMKTLHRYLFIAITWHVFTVAQAATEWRAAKEQAIQAFDTGNCAKVWQLVWPWARNGNAQAQAMLATGAHAAGLMPPGSPRDAMARLRHMLILSAHGALDGDAANTELLNSLLKEPVIADAGGRVLRLCLAGKSSPSHCINAAVERGFIPPMESYARELDRTEKHFNAMANSVATCDIRPAPLKPML